MSNLRSISKFSVVPAAELRPLLPIELCRDLAARNPAAYKPDPICPVLGSVPPGAK
jgi:hypothetical protein